MKEYTLSEFRANTRQIFNEALQSPVKIVRYDEEFILSNATQLPDKVRTWETSSEKPTTKPKEAVASVNPGNVSATAKSSSQEKSYDLCKHGSVKGFCKLGCK